MSICSTHSSTPAPDSTVALNGYRLTTTNSNRRDAELLEGGGVLRFAQIRQQAGVHPRVQGLDPAVEHLRETGQLLHPGDGNTFFGNGFRGRAGRDDLHAGVSEPFGEFDQTGLVVDADQRATNLPLLLVRAAHPIVAFRPIQVTPPVATAAITSTKSRRSVTLMRSCRVSTVVVVEHRNSLLGKYRPGVGAGVHQVHRAPGDFGAVGQRIGHPVRARNAWQQSWMGVQRAALRTSKGSADQEFS